MVYPGHTAHNAGRSFLEKLLLINGLLLKDHSIRVVNISRQKFYIDVLAELEIDEDSYILLIEDKVGTSDDAEKMSRYVEAIKRAYPDHIALPVYIQTGSECDFIEAEKAGFTPIKRSALIDCLQVDTLKLATNHPILEDYLNSLKVREARYNAWREEPFQNWQSDSESWFGLFDALRENFEDLEWRYVSNPQGGFAGTWWSFTAFREETKLYMQMDESLVTIRIQMYSEPEVARRTIADEAQFALQAALNGFPWDMNWPKRRRGKTMRLTSIKMLDLLEASPEDVIDLDKLIRRLKQLEEVKDNAASKLIEKCPQA